MLTSARRVALAVNASSSYSVGRARVLSTRRMPARPPRLCELIEAVDSELASGFTFSSDRSGKVADALGRVSAEDVGMGSFPQRRSQGLLPRLMNRVLGIKTSVRYKPVAETGNYTIGVFTLDDVGSAIPLHDHPGMAVYSRLLVGELQVRSFDWVQPEVSTSTGRAAVLVRDQVFKAPADFSLLADSGGNLHTFRALAPCAVLDVLVPPYRNGDRPCTYYAEESSFAAGEALAAGASAPAAGAWLVPIPQPAAFYVGTYQEPEDAGEGSSAEPSGDRR